MFWEKSQEIGEDRFVCIQQMKRAIVIWSSFYYELQIGQYIVLTGLTWAQIPIQSFQYIQFLQNIHIFHFFPSNLVFHFYPLLPLLFMSPTFAHLCHFIMSWKLGLFLIQLKCFFFFLLASFPPLKSLMLFLLVKNWEETLHTKKSEPGFEKMMLVVKESL